MAETVPFTVIATPHMTEVEWARVGRERSRPVVELLGLVVDRLGTYLAEAEWTHGWIGLGSTARYEWAGGPSLAYVVELLLPTVAEGEVAGVPGLRQGEVRERSATLRWLPAAPTELHLTWLPARGERQHHSPSLGEGRSAPGVHTSAGRLLPWSPTGGSARAMTPGRTL